MKFQHLSDSIGHILDEHMNKVNQINKSIHFSDMPEIHYENQPLTDLLKNISSEKDELTSMDALERVEEIRLALQKASQIISVQAKSNELSAATYDEFQTLSYEFIIRLWRFEKDFSKEGNGIDPLTGLRSNSVIIEDLTRELSACARRGDYLGIAVGCIDSFATLRTKVTEQQRDDILVFVSQVLKKTMRLYDDGYRYKDNMFAMCFKHTDHLGAVSAIERFVRLIREAHETEEGRRLNELLGQDITLSYSVAKLEVGADVRSFLAQLEEDVKENADEESSILEYEDKSDLERYVRDFRQE